MIWAETLFSTTHKKEAANLLISSFFVIRLDFVPFGYFLALSISFPRPYALS